MICRKIATLVLLLISGCSYADSKSVVFIAGPPSHTWDTHNHHAGCDLLAEALEKSGLNIKTSVYRDKWPVTMEEADAVVIYSDGGKDNIASGHEATLRKLSDRGTGIVFLHWATEPVEDKLKTVMTDCTGGYFETNWSVNPIWTLKNPVLGKHPVTRGVRPFELKEEWYYHMRFRENMTGITPVLSALPPADSVSQEDDEHSGNPAVRKAIEDGIAQHVAWVSENKNGSRGFGFTAGHYHKSWANDDYRKIVLNGIAWTAGVEIPANGVPSITPVIPTHQSIVHAIAKQDLEDITRHITTGADVNQQNKSLWSPLHYAAVRGNTKAAALLLENGARVDMKTRKGKTALHFAADRNFIELAELLLDNGANIIEPAGDGWTPLHLAAARNRLEMARMLIKRGADTNALSLGGGTPLHEGAASASGELIQLLLDSGSKPETKARNGKTALDYAIELKNKEAEQILKKLKP